MEDLKKIVAKNITALRVSAGMTQSDLGEQLLYSDKSISKWERGDALPDVIVLKKMSTIFGVTVDYLCLLYTSPSPRDGRRSRMPSSA